MDFKDLPQISHNQYVRIELKPKSGATLSFVEDSQASSARC